MRDIHCPKDIGFENTFIGEDCQKDQFYNNCYHCWSTALAKGMDKWIPVSERLPEKNVEVLVTTEWGAITIGEMFSSIDWFIHEGTTNADIDEIVAWMPLPKPYDPQERSGEE